MQRGNTFTFAFAFLICVVCSVSLAVAATYLKPAQDVAQRLDVIKNILSVAGYPDEEIAAQMRRNPRELIATFEQNFHARIVDQNNREVPLDEIKSELVTRLGYNREELDQKQAFEIIQIFQEKLSLLAASAGQTEEQYDPGYNLLLLYQPEGQLKYYIVPVEGYGLWDMIYGYIALEPDLNTVADIRFYKHQETPGLGGECSKPWFTNNFRGKKILNDQGEFVSIAVVKGKAAELHEGESLNHYVDGISGGTITGQGITRFLREDLGRYNEYFQTIRTAEAPI